MLRRQLAEAGLDGHVEVDSAGSRRLARRRGRGPAVRGAAARLPGLEHRARLFTAADFAERDLVVALDSGHQRELWALAPTAADRDKVRLLGSYDLEAAAGSGELDVPDPYYGGPTG